MAELRLERQGWNYRAFDGEEEVSELRAEIVGDCAMVHQTVRRFSPSTLKALRRCYALIREDFRAAGVKKVVASSDQADEKMEKYWRLMGFEYIDGAEINGCAVRFAVMEV